jgi:hypothetical protein
LVIANDPQWKRLEMIGSEDITCNSRKGVQLSNEKMKMDEGRDILGVVLRPVIESPRRGDDVWDALTVPASSTVRSGRLRSTYGLEQWPQLHWRSLAASAASTCVGCEERNPQSPARVQLSRFATVTTSPTGGFEIPIGMPEKAQLLNSGAGAASKSVNSEPCIKFEQLEFSSGSLQRGLMRAMSAVRSLLGIEKAVPQIIPSAAADSSTGAVRWRVKRSHLHSGQMW